MGHSQKNVSALRIVGPPVIDGILNDSSWVGAEEAVGFVQRELHPGMPSSQVSKVKFVYDDFALYIGAELSDVSADSVLRELSVRDNEANADLFGVLLDTYNDDLNAFGFFVTAAGTQIDARYSSQGQDFEWNAVWLSAVQVHDKGWTVEMKIPYSALRFSREAEQVWGLNILRKIRRLRENSFWSPLDPAINALIRQSGNLTGLKNIKPPLRLSLSPYIAAIADHFPFHDPAIKNLNYNVSGGMDIKYGLTDAFTLDMTLVPDFSQVQSDNQVLNLSPFEVQFQERRPFFTEGTELFNKGGLFYSRRVGGLPLDYYLPYQQAGPDEKVIRNPSQTQLLNATKLSGRTPSKLGIGVFNALSAESYATLANHEGALRQIRTSPLTNYNIVVLDQTFKNNSFASFINTNVLREGSYYDANVSGASFRLNNKTNTWQISGASAVSAVVYPSQAPNLGYSGDLSFGKSGGNFKWNMFGRIKTDKYDHNDLGILFLSNNIESGLTLSYDIYKPFWKLNNSFNNITIMYQRMYEPGAFWNFGIYGENITTFTKKFLSAGIEYGAEPVITYDYYEARVPGRFYTFPVNYYGGAWISTDYRRPFAVDVFAGYREFEEFNRYNINLSVSPRFRANNRLSFIYEVSDHLRNDDVGFVSYNKTSDTITFGRRNMETVSNIFSALYKFTNKMSLSFRLRHYWSKAVYRGYYELDRQGSLNKYSYHGNHNVNFNAFNIDMVFFWQFAPGSELNLVWKTAVIQNGSEIVHHYYRNFRSSFNADQNNTFSLKVLYYLDYLDIKKTLQKRGFR